MKSKEVVIDKAFYSVQIPSADRVHRKEAYEMKNWKRLKFGTFHISEGKQFVKLRALKIPNENVAEIKLVRLMPAE
jgi:hypothetical protein